MVDFKKDWYEKLIARSNEKRLLVEKISDLLQGKTHESCLEIGLGTSTYFSDRLGDYFQRYFIVEKADFKGPFKENVTFIKADFDDVDFDSKFDVVIASHVVYYFKNLYKSTEKIYSLLNEGGRAYFVVNGRDSDYGPVKNAFASFINEHYIFTYDLLKKELEEYKQKEYTAQASLSFISYEDLFDTLRLSFDLYPEKYEENKDKVMKWLEKNVKGDKFFIDQKIIEISK